MSNIIELKLNVKLVLREKDEKGKFMIVKQGIKGNKNINENAYRLVYRLIRDFLSWKSLNSVNYNIETKELTYSDDQPNVETQQRNIQIDDISEVDSHKLKHYTQITGNYSKPNLAILTLGTDGKLNIAIYIPESLDNELIDNESIYYAMLIKEIQKLNKNPTFANLFKNVEKNYTFSENEPVYSVFEKLNDLTNKLENKHFNELTVEYFIKTNSNIEKVNFKYSMNEKPKGEDHNLKFLPFKNYLQNYTPTFNNENIEETPLGFLLDLAIKRYDIVHDKFTPLEAGRETTAAPPAPGATAEPKAAAVEPAPGAEAEVRAKAEREATTTQVKLLEIIRGEIITKLKNIADSNGNMPQDQDKANNVNTFMQFSLFNTEKMNDERYVGNLGIGKRFLSDDNLILKGFNTFLDYDHYGNTRVSLGGEIKSAVMGLTSNYYKKVENGSVDEEVLDGYNIELSSQVPYLHWADIFYNSYKWDGVARDDIKGSKRLNKKLLEVISNYVPDIIILGHADLIKVETLEYIKRNYPNIEDHKAAKLSTV